MSPNQNSRGQHMVTGARLCEHWFFWCLLQDDHPANKSFCIGNEYSTAHRL